MKIARRSPRAFTLIELMVLIGILGVLMGLLLPALGAARARVAKTKELSNLRQVGMAWAMYANHNDEKVLPGYLETVAQERWRVRHEYPTDHSFIPPAPNFSPGDPNIAGPWTWRLLPYLDYNHDIVHGYRREAEESLFAMVAEAEEVAETPAFGYNAFYVGGWMDITDWGAQGSDRQRVVPRFALSTSAETGKTLNLVVDSIASIRKTNDMVVFCSSAVRSDREFRKVPDNIDGSHFVVPPYLAEQQMWRLPSNIVGEGVAGTTLNSFDSDSLIESVGDIDGVSVPVPIGRYTGSAAVLYADGSVENQTPAGLLDMRKWVNIADSKNYTHRDWKHSN